MKYFFIASLALLINLLFPFSWLDVPCLLAFLVLMARPIERGIWFILILLLIEDLLHLRPVGYSFFLVLAIGWLCSQLYKRFLPHRKWVWLSVGVVAYVVYINVDLLAAFHRL